MNRHRTDRQSKDTLGPPSVSPSLRGDLQENLVPFVTELHSHLARDLGKRTGEIWQEESGSGCCLSLASQAGRSGDNIHQRLCRFLQEVRTWLLLHFCLPDLMQNIACGQCKPGTLQGREFLETQFHFSSVHKVQSHYSLCFVNLPFSYPFFFQLLFNFQINTIATLYFCLT